MGGDLVPAALAGAKEGVEKMRESMGKARDGVGRGLGTTCRHDSTITVRTHLCERRHGKSSTERQRQTVSLILMLGKSGRLMGARTHSLRHTLVSGKR